MPVLFRRRLITSLTGIVVGALAIAGLRVAAATPAAADTAPPVAGTRTTVSADVLPTVQVNGVVWAQLVVGNRVYVTGEFTSARPAGSAAGTNETPRSNILAYDIDTGALVASWAPSLNAQGLTLAASADGTRLFVGGDFTSVSGITRYRIAALNAATGAVLNWTPGLDARVRVLTVSGDTLYAGGIFSTAANQPRTRLAAFSVTTGALLPWAPSADDEVLALTVPPGAGNVVVGGRFTLLNGAANYGLGALDASTGAVLPFAANAVVRNAGDAAAILSLTNDGTTVYGSGYTFGAGGNLENTFAADAATGTLKWVSGCRGDTYSTSVVAGVLYFVGHAHDCGMIGGWPQASPTWTYQRAVAVTTDSLGNTNVGGNFAGRPAPNLLHWLPTLATGTYTHQTQAAWSVTSTSKYVLLGGEFPSINGVAQQGLARFAVKDSAPNLEGPQGYATLAPTATAVAPGAVRLSWTAAWDRDNTRLTYELLRGAQLGTATVLTTGVLDTNWWTRPAMAFTDTSAPPGSAQSYRVRVKDPFGNTMISTTTATTVPAGPAGSTTYQNRVKADGASADWRLGESSGVAYDWAGAADLTPVAGATRAVAGAISGDTDGAITFPGTTAIPAVTGGAAAPAPQTFSVEAWFRTTSTTGGKIIGFGNKNNALSTSFDRNVYLNDAGQLVFGVSAGTVKTVAGTTAYNDGQWHQVVGTLGPDGLRLYADGSLVATRADATSAAAYSGWWRVGGDTLNTGWPTKPTSNNLAGSLDEVAAYPSALSAAAVLAHFQLGRGITPNQAPTAAFTATVTDRTAAVDATTSADSDGTIASYAWNFGDGATATGVTASHPYTASGAYQVTLTVTDNSGATGTTTKSVVVTDPNQPPSATFTSTVTNRSVAVDATGSADPDGSVASYGWNFGDGGTATGLTASHLYAAAGAYTVTLTVTDNRGGTGTTTRSVTAVDPPANTVVGADAFGRTVASGFGTADTGGAWTVSGAGVTTSVSGGSAVVAPGIGQTGTFRLPGAAAADTDLTQTLWSETVPTGGGVYLSTAVRTNGTTDYRVKLRVQSTGAVLFNLARTVTGTETALTTQITLPGISYTAGMKLHVRVQAVGNTPTTVRAKVWVDGQTEPAAWTQTVTDSTAGLQVSGGVALVAFTSGSATAVPVVHYDDLTVTKL